METSQKASIGSSLDSWLIESGIYDECASKAIIDVEKYLKKLAKKANAGT
jgi:hypothetical protein